MANPIYRDWEKAGVTPGSSPYAKEVFPFPGYQEDLTSLEKKAKEEQFARTLTRGVTKGIGTLASPEGVGALAKEAIKSQVTKTPFGVGILSKYLRGLEDGPQPEISFDLDWTPEGPAVTVETKTPSRLTSAMEYPEPDVRREMKFSEDGEVVSYTDWGEGKRALKSGKPRLIEHRTRAQPRHRLEGQVKGAMQGYEDLDNPERLLLGLYSWEPTRQPTPREVEQLARFKDDSIAYENLSPYWTEGGDVEPRAKIRPTRNYSTEGWKEKLQHEFDAADRAIKARVSDRMGSGSSYEDALAEAQSLAKEVKGFITSNKNEEADRASLSEGAQEFLHGMESRGDYPYERFIIHEQTVEGIKRATEGLRQAYGTGDLGSARDAIKAVEDLKKTYRDAQMWAGQPHVFQPHELVDFEDLLVSRQHRAPMGSLPLSPEAYRVQEKGSEVWGRMPDWLQGVPDALHPLVPVLKNPKPWIAMPTMGLGAGELHDPTIDRVALGLASKEGIDPREVREVMFRAEKHVQAGVPMPEWDFLIRPEWARKKTSLEDSGFTLEQVFEIKRLAAEKGVSPEDMADKVLFGNVLPPSEFERWGMGENPLFIAVGALSRIAQEFEDIEADGGNWQTGMLGLVPGWKEGNKLLADIVPDDPEHRTERMRSLYLGEKMLGVPRQIWKKIEGGLELALSDLPAHQWTMYSYLYQNTDRASDWEGLRKVLGEAQIAADHKYPSIPGLWAKYEGRDPLSFQLTPLALLPIETPEWYHEKPSEGWFARGFEHPGAQVMQLSRFPLDALEETRNAVEQFTGPAKEEEALRHLTQTAAGFIEPPLQSFTNPRWAWENQGFLLSSLNYLMLKKPVVKTIESALKPYLDKLTDGKPIEMEFGAVRETYKKGEYAKPTKELETGLRGALDEFEALKLEAQRTKMFDRKVAEYGIEGTFRTDAVGRQYLWNPRVGKRMYVDEFKVSKETGAIYWEETIAPEPVKTPAPRQRGGKAHADYERSMGRRPPAERPIVEKDFEFQKLEKAETPEAQAAMEAKWGPKAAAEPVAQAETGAKLPQTAAEIDQAFTSLAEAQRAGPEQAMLYVQRELRLSPLYDWALEHVGDLIHRMTERTARHLEGGYDAVGGEVDKLLRQLKHEYGFEKELLGQFEASGVRPAGLKAAETQLRRGGQAYANEHKKLPIYNEVQRLANDAAIAVGEFRFGDAIVSLEKLKGYLDKGPEVWAEKAFRVEPKFARVPAPKPVAEPAAVLPTESIYIEVPGHPHTPWDKKRVEVIQNPTKLQENQLRRESRKQNRDYERQHGMEPAPSAELELRRTFDAEGNQYIWNGYDATHFHVEGVLTKRLGRAFSKEAPPKAAPKPAAKPTPAPKATEVIHEVGHIDPRHPDMQFNTVEQFLAVREQRAKWVKQRRGSLNKAIKKYRDQLVEDYEMIVNPDLSIDWTRKTGEGYKKRSYWIERKGQETSPALAELRELTRQIKGQWNGRWTKIKILKALPVIAEAAIGGPVFGSLELTGLLLNKILGSRAPGPLQAWVRYMFKSPEKVVPAVVRLMEYETGLQSRRYTMQLTQMLANTPEKHWGTLSDIMHGEAAAVTVDAARINDWASKKIAALETEAQRQEVRDAAGRLQERVKAVSVEKMPGTTKPLYDEAVQRVRAVRYNETARRFQVDPDVRKIASANEINNLQSMTDVANEYGKNWVEETLRLTDEAIELGMFDNPDSLHRIYWPQMYENVGRLRTAFKTLQRKGLSTKDLMGETNKVMLEIKRRAKEAKIKPTQAQMESRLRRLGVPIEDRAAVYGMRRGGDAFASEALGGLFELQNAVAQRKLYRDIINLHPRLWRSRPEKGFVLVPESLKRGGTDVATFGDLTGKYVQADLWEHIRRMEEFKQDLNWIYPKMLQFWKGMRTHHHVPTLMRNIFTNKLLFEPMAGIGMHDPRNWKLWKESIGDFMKYETSKEFKISLETGVFEGTWSRVELNRAQVHELINMIYPHWRDFKKPLLNTFTLGMRYSKGKLSKDLKKIVWDLPGVVYSMADDISRHTYARKRRAELKKKGYKADEAARIAADEARKKFIDYENVPGFVQFLRAPSMRPGPLLTYLMMGKPFLAFSARAVPMFYDWLKTNPIQATLWMNLHNYLTGLAYAEEGITFEEMRAFRTMLPGHMVNRHMPERGTVKAHRDESGKLVDITADWRGFGWMNPFDVAIMQSEFNDEGSAFIHLLGMFGPGDPFRKMAVDIQRTFQSQDFGPGGIKRPVWRKRMTTESGLDFAIRATGDVLGYAYQGVMSPSLPGGSLWNQTVAAIGGLPDQYNRVQTVEQVASRWLGLFDVEDVSFRRRVEITAKKMRQAMATDDKRAASEYVKKRFGLPSYNKEALKAMEKDEGITHAYIVDLDDGKLVMPEYIIATYEMKKAQLAMPRLKKYYDAMTYLKRDAAGDKKVILEAAESPPEILDLVGRGLEGMDRDLHMALMEDLQFFAKKGWKIKSDDARDSDPGVYASTALDVLKGTEASIGIGTRLAQMAEEVSLEEMGIKLRRLNQAADKRARHLIGEGKSPVKEALDKKALITDPYKLDEILK